jgi:hypothetical protein
MKFLIYGLIVLAATVYGMYKLFLVNFAVNDFTFRITDLKKINSTPVSVWSHK